MGRELALIASPTSRAAAIERAQRESQKQIDRAAISRIAVEVERIKCIRRERMLQTRTAWKIRTALISSAVGIATFVVAWNIKPDAGYAQVSKPPAITEKSISTPSPIPAPLQQLKAQEPSITATIAIGSVSVVPNSDPLPIPTPLTVFQMRPVEIGARSKESAPLATRKTASLPSTNSPSTPSTEASAETQVEAVSVSLASNNRAKPAIAEPAGAATTPSTVTKSFSVVNTGAGMAVVRAGATVTVVKIGQALPDGSILKAVNTETGKIEH